MKKTLTEYLNDKIKIYKNFDRGHNITHVEAVLKYSIDLAKHIKNVNMDLVKTIAVFHDLGLGIGKRKEHHTNSAKLVREDVGLKTYFDADEIKIIEDAVLNHRASNTNTNLSIYSKIIMDADKSDSLTDINRMVERAFLYNLDTSNDTPADIYTNVYNHLFTKYGKSGYVKYQLPITMKVFKKNIDHVQNVLQHEKEFKKVYLSVTSRLIKQFNLDKSLLKISQEVIDTIEILHGIAEMVHEHGLSESIINFIIKEDTLKNILDVESNDTCIDQLNDISIKLIDHDIKVSKIK